MIVLPEREKIATKRQFPKAVLHTLDAFYTITSAATWQTPLSIKQTFPTANILKCGRVIFDIEDQYHLVIKVNYQMQAVKVCSVEQYGGLSQILLNS